MMIEEKYELRSIKRDEAARAAEIEQIVFPPNEAVPAGDVIKQAETAPELFLVAVDRKSGELAGLLNGMATDEDCFRDDFFTDKSLHKPDGKNVMLLGLDVLPEHRMQGLGRKLMSTYIEREKKKGREKIILTCLPKLVDMYSRQGFTDKGMSASTWGGESWHEMEYDLTR